MSTWKSQSKRGVSDSNLILIINHIHKCTVAEELIIDAQLPVCSKHCLFLYPPFTQIELTEWPSEENIGDDLRPKDEGKIIVFAWSKWC